mgnify:FL=1
MKDELKKVEALRLLLNAAEDLGRENKDDVLLDAVDLIRSASLFSETEGKLFDLSYGEWVHTSHYFRADGGAW